MSSTDTNQASEDEASLIPFEMVVLAHMELAYESTDEARRATESVVGMVKALIRTEKLKLLDEVIHQSTVNLKSAKAVAGWAELRKNQLKAEL